MSVTEPNKRDKGTCSSGTPKQPAENKLGPPKSGGVDNPKESPLHISNLRKPGGTRANRV